MRTEGTTAQVQWRPLEDPGEGNAMHWFAPLPDDLVPVGHVRKFFSCPMLPIDRALHLRGKKPWLQLHVPARIATILGRATAEFLFLAAGCHMALDSRTLSTDNYEP